MRFAPVFAIRSSVALALTLMGGVVSQADGEGKHLTLTVKSDKKRYDSEDTILILAKFTNEPTAKLQFADDGCGSLYFHIILEPVAAKGKILCKPIRLLQFEPWAEIRGEACIWLKDVDTGVTRQLAVHLPRIKGLPQGKYKLRLAYTCWDHLLEPMLKTTFGEKVAIDSLVTARLKNAWDSAVISDPIIIDINLGDGKE